jgi:hypothetical protein
MAIARRTLIRCALFGTLLLCAAVLALMPPIPRTGISAYQTAVECGFLRYQQDFGEYPQQLGATVEAVLRQKYKIRITVLDKTHLEIKGRQFRYEYQGAGTAPVICYER